MLRMRAVLQRPLSREIHHSPWHVLIICSPFCEGAMSLKPADPWNSLQLLDVSSFQMLSKEFKEAYGTHRDPLLEAAWAASEYIWSEWVPSWERLGTSRRRLWSVFGTCWSHLRPSRSIFGKSWTRFSCDLEANSCIPSWLPLFAVFSRFSLRFESPTPGLSAAALCATAWMGVKHQTP